MIINILFGKGRILPAFCQRCVDFSFQLGHVFLYCFTTYFRNLHVFISVLLVFILKVSTLFRGSFLLLFKIICSYFISVIGAGNIYFISYVYENYLLHLT